MMIIQKSVDWRVNYYFILRLTGLEEHGIEIAYRMPDGRLNRAQGDERILGLLYADDLVLISKNEEGLIELVARFEQTTKKWGLTTSEKKTKTLIVKNSGVRGPHRTVDIRGEPTEMVSNFVYLGCLVVDTSSSNAEINRRISMGA